MNLTDASTLAEAIKRCESEPIQYIGSIQGYGVLIGIDDHAVVRVVSANLAAIFDLTAEGALGLAADTLFGTVSWKAINSLDVLIQDQSPVPLEVHIRRGQEDITRQAFVHRSAHFLVIEIEGDDPTGSAHQINLDATGRVLNAILADTANLRTYTAALVHQVRGLTGFDRVMVYQFDHLWNGKVIAESRNDEMGSFLEHHFPAADIPEPARRLYTKNLVRMLVDRDAIGVPLIQSAPGFETAPVDLSFSVLRSMSPVHLEYLKNMDVASSVSVSLLQHGRLWGLMVCHHRTARRVPMKLRETLELIARTAAIRLSALAFDDSLRYQGRMRETLRDLLVWAQNIPDLSALIPALQQQLLSVVNATGLAIVTEGECCCFGQTPPLDVIHRLQSWAVTRAVPNRSYSTHALGADFPAVAGDTGLVAGLLAIPLDETGNKIALWFRHEVVHSTIWAGEAHKHVVADALGPKLEPRQSFALWEKTQRGESEPWLEQQHDAAQTLSITLGKILADQGLRQSEESLRLAALVYQSSSEAMVVTDAANAIIAINPAFTKLTGYSLEEILGHSLRGMSPSCHDVEFYRAMWQAIDTTGEWRGEVWNQHKNGALYAAFLAINTIFDAEGAVWRRVGLSTDITERKQAEEMLRVSDIALKSVSQGVLITRPDQSIISANDAFKSITGYSETEVMERNCRFLQGPLTDPKTVKSMNWALKTETEFYGEILNYRKDGTPFWNELTISPVRNEHGQLTHFIGITRDITARKLTEDELGQHRHHLEQLVFSRTAELAEARDAAESANRAKSAFLATMSHELRTPLNAVVGLTRLLADSPLNRRQHDYTDKIQLSAQALRALMDDILDFSKIEAGALQLEQAPFSLNAILRTMAAVVGGGLGNKPIEALFDVPPDIPDALMGDALRLQQILMNLTSNAVKFTNAGEIVISVRCLQRVSAQVTLQFSVRDTGIGITPEQLGPIFDGFVQADASTSRMYGGSGLGLTISARLAQLMGGQIVVESALGRGSEFRLEMPLTLGITEPLVASSVVPSGLSLLIIDDHPLARDILTRTCAAFGWQATAVDSGAAGLEELRRSGAQGRDYDLLLLDWRMPDMDGLEMLRAAIATPGIGLPLVVLMTSIFELEQAVAASDDLYLDSIATKPMTPASLFEAVTRAYSGESTGSLPQRGKTDQRLAGMCLLVAEDNALNQEVIKQILTRAGAEVVLTANGLDAVAALQVHGAHFDAVLMDIQMPVMDGYTATRIIREQLGWVDLPIIAVTAFARPEDREISRLAGMAGHLVKPINVEDLLDLVAKERKNYYQGHPALKPIALAQTMESAIQMTGLDIAAALDDFGGDAKKYSDMLRKFVTIHGGDIAEARRLFNAADVENTARLIHGLRGIASLLRATELTRLAAAAERVLQDGKLEMMPHLFDQLQDAMQTVALLDKSEIGRYFHELA